uniref:Biliverdin reductase catalytic domain-containing protein n=1 Tax=Eptatretus burgeri TaxID=7764 RepID=A0A8C4R0X7_EPTBU
MKGKLVNTVVVGVGMAGRVLIRDVLHLEAITRKRSLAEIAGTQQITLPEALTCPDVQAAIISTENAAHEETYPLALSTSAAQNLFKLSDKMGRVLHVEHIELLTSQYKQLHDQVEGKTLEQGCLHFTGGPLMDFEKCGFPSFSGVSRLSWLVNLFGELQVEAATMEERHAKQYFQLRAKLLNKMLTWVEERRPGYIGAKRIQFQFVGGSSLDELPPTARGTEGLFFQDLHIFSSKLQAMLADTIHNLCCGSPNAIDSKSKTLCCHSQDVSSCS